MKHRWIFILSVAIPALVVAACAGSDDEVLPPANDADAATKLDPEDAGEQDQASPAVDAESVRTTCSAAGWCVVPIPDTDLEMKDVWPLANRAFAIAESPTLGVKVLEWSAKAGAWNYIDDASQNGPGLGLYAGGIWAPNDDEVYFGVGPGQIFHGTRPVPPATAWIWTHERLPDNNLAAGVTETAADGQLFHRRFNVNLPSLGIWGTSGDDVYAWHTNTIFHRDSVGGNASWSAVHSVTDKKSAAERVSFLSASGTSADDIWFSGARSIGSSGHCAIVVRKTVDGFVRVADEDPSSCAAKAGYLALGSFPILDLQPISSDTAIGLRDLGETIAITRSGASYTMTASTVPTAVVNVVSALTFYSLWANEDDVWLSGRGRIVRGSAVWDGGSYGISTIASDTAPIGQPLFRIRGTSTSNLWAIGSRYALHKTTP